MLTSGDRTGPARSVRRGRLLAELKNQVTLVDTEKESWGVSLHAHIWYVCMEALGDPLWLADRTLVWEYKMATDTCLELDFEAL